MPTPTERVKAEALALGFSKVGIARAAVLEEEPRRLKAWLDRRYQAGMSWMERNIEKKTDVGAILPGARSVVSVALNYYMPLAHSGDERAGKISRYAWGDDYHGILGKRLEALSDWVEGEFTGEKAMWYVDTGPVMDKVWAARAGIGREGKHTNVITQEYGSWVFLGEMLTTLDLEPDEPAADHCGTCTLCIDACPTAAIVEPYVVDANLCISYLTIEHRGEIGEEIAGKFGRWIYGCDICQDVCPWNHRFATPSGERGFEPRAGNAEPVLAEWADMSQEEFRRRFKGSPVKRAKWTGLMRNIRAVFRGGNKEG
jgi:epoxyqueuosine reductase